MDDATVALVGAAIGAGGAVTAQVIAGILTQRSARARFKWEQEQARAQRFIETKRELCAAYLAAHSEFYNTLVAYYRDRVALPGLEAAYEERIGVAARLSQEIALIAPDLRRPCLQVQVEAINALHHAQDDSWDFEVFLAEGYMYGSAQHDCQEAMSDLLLAGG